MKMGTCADCGQPMHRGTTSLPQGEARCRVCRAMTQRTNLEEKHASRRNYRLKAGIPLDAPLYQSDKPQWRRTWVA